MIEGVLHRFARKGSLRLYLTLYNGDFILWLVEHGIIIQEANYEQDEIEAETAFNQAKNKL